MPRSRDEGSVASAVQGQRPAQHRAGLLAARRDGRRRAYRLSGDAVVGLLGALRAVPEAHHARSQPVVHDFLAARDALEPVGREELLAGFAEGSVTLIDVRSADEFASGHLGGGREPAPVRHPGGHARPRTID